MRIGLPGIVYLVIGAFVAQAHHYFAHADALKQVISAALAVVLWPFIVVFGLHFHVTSRRRSGAGQRTPGAGEPMSGRATRATQTDRPCIQKRPTFASR
jgi:hypothetical protein